MAIPHERQTTRTELREFLSLDLFSFTSKNIFQALLGGSPPMDPPLQVPEISIVDKLRRHKV